MWLKIGSFSFIVGGLMAALSAMYLAATSSAHAVCTTTLGQLADPGGCGPVLTWYPFAQAGLVLGILGLIGGLAAMIAG